MKGALSAQKALQGSERNLFKTLSKFDSAFEKSKNFVISKKALIVAGRDEREQYPFRRGH